MELWLDTCEPQVIISAQKLGIIKGVTTNPKILAESRTDPEQVINKLLNIQEGPIAVQVTADTDSEMIQQGVALHALSERLIVKVPVTQQGLIAMKELVKEGIYVMATAVFHAHQVMLAGIAGADYVAPYVSRMIDSGIDATKELEAMVAINRAYGFKTKILAAALRNVEQVMACARLGISAATMKSALFSQFIADDPQTTQCLREFADAWESVDSHLLA